MVNRYNCYGKDDFGHKYEALVSVDHDGTCVLASDYAALEARCRDAAKLISDVVETPDQFETEWNKAAREWLASTSETQAESPPSPLEAAFAKEPERSIVNAALLSIGTSCEHRYVDATNTLVESGEVCLQCGSIRPSQANRSTEHR